MQLMAHTAETTGSSPGGDCELDPLALADGERVRARAAGIIGSDTAMLVVTDRRVLVIREDDYESSIALPFSEVRMARWEPAADCHDDDLIGQADSESGAKWGSVRLGDGSDGVRLSLVVARDGERCVALIRAAIGLPPTDARRRGRRHQPDRRPATRFRSGEFPVPARAPESTELSTAIITPEFDTEVVPGPLIDEDLDPEALADDAEWESAAESDKAEPVAELTTAVPVSVARTSSEPGRHRIAVKSQPTRHASARSATTKRPWLAGAMALGLGAVTVIGLIAGNKPLGGLLGCTRAGDADAVAEALASAGPGDEICITSDLPALHLTITSSGESEDPVTITGKGQTLVGGITVHADNVVVSGFQVLGDPKQAIRISGNGINVANNTGAAGPLTPAWG